MGILDKITNGIGVAFGIIALIASAIAYVLFRAWSSTKQELEEQEALREFETNNRQANDEAVERVREQDVKLEEENEEFKATTDNSSISDAIQLHNDKIQNPRD